jgi:phosphatidylserine/phosphatidylglycerophosphate/cardiolipin synthase-like enzyme
MDRTRSMVIGRLKAADIFGRFRAWCPETASGHPIIVHAKVTIVDDQLVRIGSANLNNRSHGLDTECELAVEAVGAASATAITALRNRLIGHYMGRSAADIATAIDRRGGVIAAVDALNTHGRLRPIEPLTLGQAAGFVAAYHLGDPQGVADAWRPLRRRKMLHDRVRAIAGGALDAAP